jgi:hypothetical protein
MLIKAGRFTMIKAEDITSTIRHNALKLISGVPLAALSSLALGGCGLAGHNQSTVSHEQTTATAPAKKIIKKTVDFLETTIMPGQEFKETILADAAAGGVPKNNLEQSILNYPGNADSFISGIDEELREDQPLILRFNQKQPLKQHAVNYYSRLAAQMNADTTAALNAEKDDGVAFADSVTQIKSAKELGGSWHKGCPVAPSDLSRVGATYVGTDGLPHYGYEDINKTVVPEVLSADKQLYEDHVQIADMKPLSAYGGNYTLAIDAKDTMDFDCPKPSVTNKANLAPLAEYGENVVINGGQSSSTNTNAETIVDIFDRLDWAAAKTTSQPQIWYFEPSNK